LKDASQGPFIVEDEVQLEISDSVDIEGMELEALLNVRLTFASRTEASGVVAVAERENSSETAIALKWQQALPAEGPVRDGEWEMSTTDPILLAISFEVVDGIAEDLSYWLMDSSTLSIGYSGISREARIGEGLSLSIVDGVDVSVDFTGYMDAEATASVHFTTGFEQLPLDVEWFPSLPE
jgi:hypothetical protein